jgi:hypothetical protein
MNRLLDRLLDGLFDIDSGHGGLLPGGTCDSRAENGCCAAYVTVSAA